MLTGPEHMHYAKLWMRLSDSLAARCANALLWGDGKAAFEYAQKRRKALHRWSAAWHCATSELFSDFRKGPPC